MRAQPRVTARTRDGEMLQRLRSSLRWVPAAGSPIVLLSPASLSCSPVLAGPAVCHVSLPRHSFPRARSFAMACLPRTTAALARQVLPWRMVRDATPPSHQDSQGVTVRGRHKVLGGHGRVSLGTRRCHGWGRLWGHRRRLGGRHRGLWDWDIPGSPRRSPRRDAGLEIIHWATSGAASIST